MTSVFYLAVQEQTNLKRYDELVKIFPHAQLVKAATYQEAVLKAASRLLTTNHFFVVCDFHRVRHSITLVANPLERALGDDRLLNNRMDILSYPSQAWPATWGYLEREPLPTDIIFLSYDELNADANYSKLERRFGLRVKRVHGVKGIDKAHRAAAELSSTDWFYVVDADNMIEDSFDFSFYPTFGGDDKYVHIWMARNGLVPGLTYGYGGVKLFHRRFLNGASFKGLDFSTRLGDGIQYHDEIASTTIFNVDAFSTWRSTFRETVKLRRSESSESAKRLALWETVDKNAPFAGSALLALDQSKAFVDVPEAELHALINDFDALKQLWSNMTMQHSTL